jgi:hypothetical protein
MLPDYNFTRIDDLIVNYCLTLFDKENWDINRIGDKIYINVLENFYKNSNSIQESTKFLEIDQNNNVVLHVPKTINKRIFICLFYHMQEVINENLKEI